MVTISQQTLSNILEDELQLGDEATCNRIVEENFPRGLREFKVMEESELDSMVSRYERTCDETQRIKFGLTRTRRLKGLMYHVQDLNRTGDPIVPSVITMTEINNAIDNNRSRNIFISQSASNMAVATPLKFEKEKD